VQVLGMNGLIGVVGESEWVVSAGNRLAPSGLWSM